MNVTKWLMSILAAVWTTFLTSDVFAYPVIIATDSHGRSNGWIGLALLVVWLVFRLAGTQRVKKS